MGTTREETEKKERCSEQMKKKWKERLNRKILFPLLHRVRGREEAIRMMAK